MAIPGTIYQNTSAEWSYSYTGYSDADGWASAVVLRSGTETASFAGVADGSGWKVSVTAAASAAVTAGEYTASVVMTKGAEREIVQVQKMWVLADPAGTPALTQWETDLAAVDAAIRAVVAGKGAKSYSIGTVNGSSRQLENMELSELRSHRSWLLGQINIERLRGAGKQTTYRRIKSCLA